MSTGVRSAGTAPVSWSRPTLLAGFGVVVTVVAWVWLAGPLALLFAGILAVSVVALSPPFAFALGQVLLFGVVADGTVVEILLAESGLLCILLSEYTPTIHSIRQQLATIAAIAGIGSLGVLAVRLDIDAWVVAATGIAIFSLTAYGLHRVELVRLNLVLEDQ